MNPLSLMRFLLRAAVILAAAALFAWSGPASAHEPSSKPSSNVRSDLNKGWVHIGGGFGATVLDPRTREAVRSGRFVVGAGKYVPFFYGGGEFSVTGHQYEPLKLTGTGYIGLAPPIPVFHPLLGFRAGAGHHLADGTLLPQLVVGPQVGFILRKFDGRPGFRLMVDAGWEWRPKEAEVQSELFVTFSGVF